MESKREQELIAENSDLKREIQSIRRGHQKLREGVSEHANALCELLNPSMPTASSDAKFKIEFRRTLDEIDPEGKIPIPNRNGDSYAPGAVKAATRAWNEKQRSIAIAGRQLGKTETVTRVIEAAWERELQDRLADLGEQVFYVLLEIGKATPGGFKGCKFKMPQGLIDLIDAYARRDRGSDEHESIVGGFLGAEVEVAECFEFVKVGDGIEN